MNIHEVARRARVSTATVSRAINCIPTVNPKLSQRVWKVIKELGYYPNTQARALVSGRSRIFGLIVSELTNPFFPEIVQVFETIADEKGGPRGQKVPATLGRAGRPPGDGQFRSGPDARQKLGDAVRDLVADGRPTTKANVIRRLEASSAVTMGSLNERGIRYWTKDVLGFRDWRAFTENCQ